MEMFARGLSARDIEAAFQDATGASVLSRSAVSQVTERLWQEYAASSGAACRIPRWRSPTAPRA